MAIDITVDDAIGDKMHEGKAVLLAVVFYDIEEDKVRFTFTDGGDKRLECIAILKKFKCWPPDGSVIVKPVSGGR